MPAGTLWLGFGVTVFAWWFSTGLILLMVRRPQRQFTLMLCIYGGVALLAFGGILASATKAGPLATYCAFLCALLVWGWHEASFLMGKITGPRPAPCPENCAGWQRFAYAAATLIYHEVALFVTLILIVALTWEAPNLVAAWTFGVLFVMRLSAKFNIFLGVPNLTQDFFPSHLEHLKSYLPKRAMNPLMPLSLLGCLALIAFLALELREATSQGQGPALGLVMVLTLAALGALEHVFMISPLPDAALWRWALPRAKAAPQSGHADLATSSHSAQRHSHVERH